MADEPQFILEDGAITDHRLLVAIVKAIAEVDPAAINDAIDHLDRTTVAEPP